MQVDNSLSPELAPSADGGDDGERSRQLIDAANDLLEQDGLDGLTVRAVLKRSGLARRAFYDRFAGKDDLVLAVFEETLHEAADYFRDQASHLSDPIEKLQVVVLGIVTGATSNKGIGEQRVAAMVSEHMRLAQTRPGKLQHALQPLLDFIAEEVTAGIRAGQMRDCDPVLQATLIFNLVATTLHTELMMNEASGPERRRQAQLAEDIWEFCRRALIA
jgi:AcrR family transcriptional regulator